MEGPLNGGTIHKARPINLPGVYWWESYALGLLQEQRRRKEEANIRSDMECNFNVIATEILIVAKHTGQAIEKSFITHLKELPWAISRVRIAELSRKKTPHPIPWIRDTIGGEYGLTLK
jgi:hypothetical protein